MLVLLEHLQADDGPTGRRIEVPSVDGVPTDAGLRAAAQEHDLFVSPSGNLVGRTPKGLTVWRVAWPAGVRA